MILRPRNTLLIVLIALVALAGCERAQDVVMDTVPSIGDGTDGMAATPVKLMWLIDYPADGKEVYIQWVASVAPTLQAPEEVVRIRSYDNVETDMSPNRLVEFDFKSFVDAATYLNRPEIAEILSDLPNHANAAIAYTFIQRSDYSETEVGDWQIKGLYLIDYPFGGKAAYLEWAAIAGPRIVGPPELKAIVAYDNYYGESPHRLVTLEFASQEDMAAYRQLEEVQAVEVELNEQAGSWELHVFELRSDYINE